MKIACNEPDALLVVPRPCNKLVHQRTAKANPIRGLLGEVGIAVGKGIAVSTERAGGFLQQRSLSLWDLIRMNVKPLC